MTKKEAAALDLARYLGKSCKQGHDGWRFIDGHCIECQRAKDRRIYCPEKAVARVMKWQKNRKEKFLSLGLLAKFLGKPCTHGHSGWRSIHDGGCIECDQEKDRNYRKNNRAKFSIKDDKRRKRKQDNGGSFAQKDISRIYRDQKGSCAFYIHCGIRFDEDNGYEVDHIIPVIKDGHNNPSNLQLLCRTCNRSKAAKDPIDFARSLGLLV